MWFNPSFDFVAYAPTSSYEEVEAFYMDLEKFYREQLSTYTFPKDILTAALDTYRCSPRHFQVPGHVSAQSNINAGPGRSLAMRIPSQSASMKLRETLPVLLPQKKFAFASAETKSACDSVFVVLEGSCVVNCNKTAITSGRRDRRSLKRQILDGLAPQRWGLILEELLGCLFDVADLEVLPF
ncbi:hypothetical protein RB195_008263 [Necator americanus]|uniref:Cyclic nucleotide-binding domain-containing protein n=1 Tax=Necator americanus TaxID=51031 RepID=A0ABR1CMT5_NECAM